MEFELPFVTQVTFTNANPRAEFHGEEHVRAIDISLTVETSNERLDDIQPGLLVHHYTNRAAKEGQDQLPEMISALPNLRYPKLPTTYRYAKDDKPRGYRLEIDHGLGDRNIVLEDCVRSSLSYELLEGGTVKIHVTLQNNGDTLRDDALFGRLSSLAAQGTGHVILRAPSERVLVKKGWRSGKPDTDQPTDGGAPLLERDGPGDDDTDPDDTGDQHPQGEFAEGSPEGALLDSVNREQDLLEPSKARRGRKAAAVV